MELLFTQMGRVTRGRGGRFKGAGEMERRKNRFSFE